MFQPVPVDQVDEQGCAVYCIILRFGQLDEPSQFSQQESIFPPSQVQDPPIGPTEETIASYVTELMQDGDCIQLGFGGIPNAIGFHLMGKHDLGIHTEQIGTSMAHLIDCGAVTNRYKAIDKGITVGTFISGDAFLYDFVDYHPRLCLRRSRYTNDPYVIAKNDNVVSVNASLQIDLTGQVCAKSIGPKQHSGTGGATDFAWGATIPKAAGPSSPKAPPPNKALSPASSPRWTLGPLSPFLGT